MSLPRSVFIRGNRLFATYRSIPSVQNLITSKILYSSFTYNQIDVYRHVPRQNATCFNLDSKRFKKQRGRKSQNDDQEEGDEDEIEADDEENPLLMEELNDSVDDGGVESTIDINSLRLDAFCRGAFNIARNKIEESFYKGEIYINGERAMKKSQDLSLGDEIDMIKCINQEDPSLYDIRRVQILKLSDKMSQHGRLKVDIRKWNDLTVDKYSQDGENE